MTKAARLSGDASLADDQIGIAEAALIAGLSHREMRERVRGEWFRASDRLLAYIEKLAG